MSEKAPPSKLDRQKPRRNAFAAFRETVQFTRGTLELDPWRDLSRAQRFLASNLRVVFLTFRLEVYRRLELHAQALTFKTLLSLVPLFVVVFAILSAFGGGLEDLNQNIVQYVIGYLSGSVELQQELMSYINTNTIRDAELGWVTIIILVLTVMSLLSHVENSVNTLFGVTAQRSIGVRLLSYWALLTLGPLLLLVSLALTAALQTSGFAQQVENLGTAGRLAIRSTPLLVTWLAFMVLYLTVPNTRVRLRSAILAALVAGSLWNLAKFCFAWYAHHNVTVQDIYGSLAALPMFILWVYISWILILGGAQLCFAFGHAATYRPSAGDKKPAHLARERAACRIFFAIARDFFAGNPPTQVTDVAGRLGIPGHLEEQTVNELRQGGFVIDTPGGGLVPAKDLHTVSVADLLHYFARDTGHNPTLVPDESGVFFDHLLEEVAGECQRIANQTTFYELAQRFDPNQPPPPPIEDEDANNLVTIGRPSDKGSATP